MKWKTISIFISSTFNDMQAERDYIRKYIVPRLNEELEQYCVVVQTVDLRWGVDTRNMDEGAREAKVLHVCLDAIKHTRPYFVGLLGNRYGWIPSYERMNETIQHLDKCDRTIFKYINEEKSVTELEIIFGVLGLEEFVKHSFFCLRSMDSYKGMNNVEFAQFSDDNALAADKLEKLRKKIYDLADDKKVDFEVIEYTAKWNTLTGSFEKLNEFGERLYNAILNDIKADVATVDSNAVVSFDTVNSEIKALDNFISYNVRDFVGRKQLITDLCDFLLGGSNLSALLNNKRGLFLCGTSGCGKSYLFSALYKSLNTVIGEGSLLLLAHAAGITPKSKSIHSMLDNWCRQLKAALGDNPDDISRQYNKDDFRDLCAISQLKGYHPIILIDSLDSFVNDKLLTKWDFIPANVPFVCTTLPGYAEDIVKQNSKYEIIDIDNFSREDALLLVDSVLTSQYKELSQKNVDRLLNITDENGTTSHSSPLWLKVALTILSEFGSDDFRQIHNCILDGEDNKIDDYLKKVIEQMPPTPELLFNHFVSVSCRYFSPELTNEVMSYIAISEYGLTELQLEKLLGDKWNHLEFASLRYWLKGIISNNGIDDRWVFTHAIFKQQMQCYDSEYIATFTENLMSLLVDEVKKGNGNIDEFVFQTVVHNNCQNFYCYLEQLNYSSSRSYTLNIAKSMFTLLLHYEEMTLAFLENYMSQYYSCSRFDDSIYWVETLLSEIDYYIEEPERKNNLLSRIYPLYFKFYTDADIYNGDGYMLSNYFVAHELYFDYVNFNDMFHEYKATFAKICEVYFRNKEKYGKTIRNIEFYNFYRRWIQYNSSLSRRCRRDEALIPEYCESFSRVIDELEWFVNGADFSLYNILDVYECFTSSYGRLNFAISLAELQRLSLRMHTNYMNILTWVDSKEFNDVNSIFLNKFNSVARDLIEAYVERHDGEEFPQTLLLDMYHIKYESNVQGDQTDEKSYYDSTDEEPDIASISIGDIQDLDVFYDNNCSQEDAEDNSDAVLGEIVVEDPEVLCAALEQFVLLNIRKLDDSEFDEEIFNSYSEKLLYVIKLYSERGNNEIVDELIEKNITILSRPLYDIPNNFAIREDYINIFISLSKCYGENGYIDKQVSMLETVRDALWQSYYHHIDGDVQLLLFYEIEDVYRRNGLEQRLLKHLEKRFEIACRYHIEHKYNYFYCYYADLGYLRPIYKQLLKLQHKQGLIHDAVLTIEKWLNMCDVTYCDDTDGSYKDEDYREAYEALAILYDGTPEILNGMKERKSVFFCEPLILVEHNNQWGYINHDGEVVIPCKYNQALRIKNNVAEVYDGNSWLFLSVEQQCGYDIIPSKNFEDKVLFIVKCDDKRGFANADGDIVIKPKYMYCRPFYEGMAAVSAPSGGLLNNRWGFVDINGHEIVQPDRYNDVGDFSEGLAWVSDGKSSEGFGFKGSKFGFINVKGELVIPMIYDDASSFFEGKAMVYLGDKCIYIDKNGNVI